MKQLTVSILRTVMLSTLCFLYLPSYEAEQETNRLLALPMIIPLFPAARVPGNAQIQLRYNDPLPSTVNYTWSTICHFLCYSDPIHAGVTCKGAQKPEIVSFIVSLSYKVSTIKEGVVFKEALSNL